MNSHAIKRHRRNDDGMVTAFVVIFAAALILLIGLVLDGGMILAAKSRTADDADGAARAGAQALDVGAYRATGTFQLDSAAATQAAQSYLSQSGASGTINVDGDRVTVTARRDQPIQILRVVGMGTATVTQTGSARANRGDAGDNG